MSMFTRVNGVLVVMDARPSNRVEGAFEVEARANLPRVSSYASTGQASAQTLAVIDAAFHGQADAEHFVFHYGWMTATLRDLQQESWEFALMAPPVN